MDLLDLIRQKKSQIAQLQKELKQASEELTDDHPAAPMAASTRHGGKRRGRPRAAQEDRNDNSPAILPTSSMGLAVAEMREAGKPLHVDIMIERAAAKGHKIKKTTLIGNLSRYNKDKRVVYRHKPNVYGLLELKKNRKRISQGKS